MKTAMTAGAVLAALYLIDSFVLRESDDSPTGFITKKPGFGLDDVVLGVGVALSIGLVHKFAPSVG